MKRSKRVPQIVLLTLSALGLADATYLTATHFAGETPVCAIDGCDIVLTSSFATILGIPVSLFGVLFYASVFVLAFMISRPAALKILFTLSSLGLATSFVLVYLQLYVIRSICIYCMVSAGLTFLIFLTALYLFSQRKDYSGVNGNF